MSLRQQRLSVQINTFCWASTITAKSNNGRHFIFIFTNLFQHSSPTKYGDVLSLSYYNVFSFLVFLDKSILTIWLLFVERAGRFGQICHPKVVTKRGDMLCWFAFLGWGRYILSFIIKCKVLLFWQARLYIFVFFTITLLDWVVGLRIITCIGYFYALTIHSLRNYSLFSFIYPL